MNHKQIIQAFRESGAIDEENAKNLKELNIIEDTLLRKMIDKKSVIKLENKYYLNEPVVKLHENTRKYFRMVIILVVSIFALLLIAKLLR